MGSAKFVDALPKRLVDNLVRGMQKEGRGGRIKIAGHGKDVLMFQMCPNPALKLALYRISYSYFMINRITTNRFRGPAVELLIDMPSCGSDASCGNHDQIRGGVLG